MTDIIWTIVAFFLTLLVFSYILGDNPLFRIASYLFVGVSAGYVAVLIFYQILLPRIVIPLITASLGEKLLVLIPTLLSLLLIFKLFPRLSFLGNPSMAYLVGIGAAVAIGGAITGTIFGQVQGAVEVFNIAPGTSFGDLTGQILGGGILLVGTVSSLAYFQFTGSRKAGQEVKRPAWMEFIARIGQAFIAITLGALFAGVLAASLAALIERLDFIRSIFISLFPK
jgi:hypothetical protein